MYENTLGCPATFEARRAELAALRSVGSATGDNGGGGGGGAVAAVSDEGGVNSVSSHPHCCE